MRDYYYNGSLSKVIDKLADLEPNGTPFISLYLNVPADENGRAELATFVRKELDDRAKVFASDSLDREYFERDAGRIVRFLHERVLPFAHGLAIFACAGADKFFKVIPLRTSIRANQLRLSRQPHLFPLAQMDDKDPRFVVFLVNEHQARLFVFEADQLREIRCMDNTGRRFVIEGVLADLHDNHQVENLEKLHAKEIVGMLERVVRDEEVEYIILAGDPEIIPIVREQMTKSTAKRVIDVFAIRY